MDIGIREFRANLSSILDDVEQGATVRITRRGRPSMKLVIDEEESLLDRGIREGWLSVGPGFLEPRADRRPRNTISLAPGMTIDDIIAEDRSADR
jgi:prevent-host-death family protein